MPPFDLNPFDTSEHDMKKSTKEAEAQQDSPSLVIFASRAAPPLKGIFTHCFDCRHLHRQHLLSCVKWCLKIIGSFHSSLSTALIFASVQSVGLNPLMNVSIPVFRMAAHSKPLQSEQLAGVCVCVWKGGRVKGCCFQFIPHQVCEAFNPHFVLEQFSLL